MLSARGAMLPLKPLLNAYTAAGPLPLADLSRLPGLGGRFEAILSATARFLYGEFLDKADPEQWIDALTRFHASMGGWHDDVLRARAGFLRHVIAALVRGRDPWPVKLAACLEAEGVYRVVGLGPRFWSGVAQGVSPLRLPAWTPLTWRGLERLGLTPLSAAAGPADRYRCLMDAHRRLRRLAPTLTALHLDHFLSLVAVMPGRDLFAGAGRLEESGFTFSRGEVRGTLKERGRAVAEAQDAFRDALTEADPLALMDALAVIERGAIRVGPAVVQWADRLWHADDPYPLLEAFWKQQPLPGAGLWWPTAVLHLRDPLHYAPWSEALRAAQRRLDDGIDPGDPPAERYKRFNILCERLRERQGLHPLQLPRALAVGVAEVAPDFAGFAPETFRFLAELQANNDRAWMETHRERYHFFVREPLVELCSALAEMVIQPVFNAALGAEWDTRPAVGHALSSIVRNNYGRGLPYATAQWITFARAGRAGVQLFVRVDSTGLTFGLAAGHDRSRLQTAVQRDAESFRRLAPDMPLEWTQDRQPQWSVQVPAEDARLTSPGLAEHIAETFRRLLPFVAACLPQGLAALSQRSGGAIGYDALAFQADTGLPPEWLKQTRELLALKKQLILQGVPGTGKTHVARCLARLLTDGDPEAIRVVQFHPSFSYEEFIEGIKVRSVAIEGESRSEVSYPVEPGVLSAFAARATAHPGQAHVLILDEINRGNLPRIFGECLYLLEYRDQAVELPYSRRTFQLPKNLYLIGTMNPADRSIAPLDQALRRRFSFVELAPDIEVLTAWLAAHPPAAGPAFASRVVHLFRRLNERLHQELGLTAQIGHSHFMVPALDEARLHLIWTHHIRPLLDELYAGRPERAAALDSLMQRSPKPTKRPV
jgi:uncharacterized protein (DUF2461 family)